MNKKFTDINELLAWLEVRTKEEYETYIYRPQIILLLNYIKEFQQENQQLKLTNQALSGCLKIDKEKIDYYVDRCEHLEKVLDEIREYINNYDVFKEFSFPLMKRDEENQVKSSIDYEFQTSIKKNLLQILDKVKE